MTNSLSLEKEISLIENFIDLEKMRYENRLSFNFTVSGVIENKKIAPMVLFTFVENCFKHGVSSQQESEISISLEVMGDTVFFETKNKELKYSNLKFL